MAQYKSDQITNLDAVPRVWPRADEIYGKVRRTYFSFTVPTGNAAVNDTVVLARIRNGVRIQGGHIAFEAMSTGAADASVQIGISATATKYLGTTSVDAAGKADFADTVALNFGEVLTAEAEILATVITEAWAAGKKLLGYVEYVVE